MTEPEARRRLVTHWLKRADDALVSARRAFDAGDLLPECGWNRKYLNTENSEKHGKPAERDERARIA